MHSVTSVVSWRLKRTVYRAATSRKQHPKIFLKLRNVPSTKLQTK